MKKTYFLLGEGATKVYLNYNEAKDLNIKLKDKFIKDLQYEGYDLLIIDKNSDPLTILDSVIGWLNYIEISKDVYDLLNINN